MSQYLLLRNNKETGPYSAEQLIEMGLKPFDLIWENGRSAAWRYPSEVPAFKAFAPEAEVGSLNKKITAEPRVAPQIPAELKKPKPRIKIKADLRKIEQPVFPEEKNQVYQNSFPIQSSQNVVDKPSWKDAWLDWEEEKKSVSSGKKLEPKKEPIIPRNDVPIETKFSQSLDDIKSQYVEKVLNKKKNGKGSKVFQIFVGLLLIALVGYGTYVAFIMKDSDNKTASPTSDVAPAKPPVVTVPKDLSSDDNALQTDMSTPENNSDNTPNTNNASVADNTSGTKNISEKNKNNLLAPVDNKKIVASIPPIKGKAKSSTKNLQNNNLIAKQNESPLSNKTTLPQEKKIAVTKPSNSTQKINPSLLLQQAGHSAVVQQSDGQYVRTVARRPDNNIETNNDAPVKTEMPKTIAASGFPRMNTRKNISDFVTVSASNYSRNNVQDIHLSVQNVTDFPIDLAVVDIQYFDTNNHFQKGETVYVNNIPANDNVDIRVPDSRNSSHINYKVSLVSAAQKSLYMVAD